MKQYIGTKQVKAEPMTRTEAKKLLGREIKPAKAEYGDDGYLVEYEDGYKSWSPKEVFEKAYKPYDNFNDRLIVERDEVLKRLIELRKAIYKDDIHEKVSCTQYVWLSEQLFYMQKYYKILEHRIEDLGMMDKKKCF